MITLIYLVIENKNTVRANELIYSLSSLSEVAGQSVKEKLKIVIYSNRSFALPVYLGGLDITFSILQESTISEWVKRADGHLLVVKAWITLETLRKFGTCAVLLDTDTFFYKDPEPLFTKIYEEYAVMHLREYEIFSDPKLNAFFAHRSFNSLDGNTYSLHPDCNMWNSGVVGIHPNNIHLLPEIINLTEQLSFETSYPGSKKLVEQISFSYFLGSQQNRILAAEGYIFHYWFFKYARYFLGLYFNEFQPSDREQFTQLLQENGLTQEHFSELTLPGLPFVLMGLVNRFLEVGEKLLTALPETSIVGKLLRDGASPIYLL